jgi:CRISPR-associated endonuclease Csn1
MKNILGLDLGTTSIGFGKITEGETPEESSIDKIGVRIIQYDNFSKVDKSGKVSESKNPEQDFAAGRGLSPNAGRTQKRGARKILDRYQLRRSDLIEVLTNTSIITSDTVLAEEGRNTTHSTYRSRAKAVTEKIEKDELARVFLAINKKRGYKSSRKAKNEQEGQVIDGMAIAKRLYEENLTPGQLVYQLLQEGKKYIPDFYRSDLRAELDKVWNFQRELYPEILTDEFKKELEGKGQRATLASFWGRYKFNTAENKGTREEKKLQAYKWRSEAVSTQLEKEEVAYVITEINNNLNNSSGYLGAISDRSKELYFNKETVGQYLYKQLFKNPHTRLTNQVFYRQDYLDEFEAIWNTQAKYHPELTESLKEKIRDIIIFYQRKLKSQKSLINFCEFESREIEVNKDGQKTKKIIGLRVTPKSSPLFQEFKIWQVLHNVEFRSKETKVRLPLDSDAKTLLFNELNMKGNLSAAKVTQILGYKSKEWEVNYTALEGNRTSKALNEAYLRILDIEGYDVKEILKVKLNKDEVELDDLDVSASEINKMIQRIFQTLNINTAILDFDAELNGKAFEQQASYQLWHLLYSYEGDNSNSGNQKLYELLEKKFGFKREHGKILANVTLSDDYGNISTKAMRNIYPYIKEHQYDKACWEAGYKHSAASLTTEEIANRPLKNKLELLKKNSLRNPVVEKILNQMVNVVNTLIESENSKRKAQGLPEDFHFDEIRIELARDLKKNAKERAEMSLNIEAAKRLHEQIFKKLQTEFGVKNPTRTDIIRYKLYEELKNNGYKDLYTNTYIQRETLFSKQIDIDHIIPQAKMFDDSFSNKTVVFRQDNLDKGNKTAFDYIESKYGEKAAEEFVERATRLFELGKKNKEAGISKAKFEKLKKKESQIGDGFIERDLRDSQYIAKKAKDILYDITRSVISTTGSITDRLREDWDLMNIMQELNFEKYKKLGLTELVEKKDGTFKERIVDWSKRNDHRHHAMDALTVAFTRHNHIQYLNYLNARRNENHKLHGNIIAIEAKETILITDHDGSKKRKFREPIPNFRQIAKEYLENVLVSHKAKNKVVTKNKNKIAGKENHQNTLTPRGQLHKETVYGKIKQPVIKEEKVGVKFNNETIDKVVNPKFKELLLQRLVENDNDAKKAFAGKNALGNNPIYLDEARTQRLPEKIKLVYYEDDYTIRKDVTPENFKEAKNIEKVIDLRVKSILLSRLAEYNNDPKKAFTDLDKNPIWHNRDKGISIKRVKISGIKNAESLHYKKDHLGQFILDDQGKKILVDFVSTSNNHHVAIYRDAEGDLQERVVSLFDAVQLVNAGEPVIDKNYNQGLGWHFLFTMKQNEYFVFPNGKTGFNPNEINLLDEKNKKLISPNLFRVQTLSIVKYGNSTVRDFKFRHHLETTVEDKKELHGITYQQLKSLPPLAKIVKVRINHIGDIVMVGE